MRAKKRVLRRLVPVGVLVGLAAAVVGQPVSGSAAPGDAATVRRPVHADTSPALRDITPEPFREGRIIRPEHEPPSAPTGGAADPVVQSTTTGQSAAVSSSTSFEGLGVGFQGPAGTFSVQYAPPDTNGDVSATNYVQVVNVGLAIFDKSGNVVYGPAPTNTVFTGFGGGCETNNDGDATVKYDRAADRWIISQFSVSTKPYLQCIAVSTTGDPTGSYYRYSFDMGRNFPDYPKLGVWADGYYTTFNMFSGNIFAGAEVCAYNRAALIVGPDQASAIQVCVSPSGAASLLPADIDGPTLPPSGAPNYLLTYGTSSLKLWRFGVDWSSPSSPSSSLSGPTTIGVQPFTAACGGACIPQSGTSQKLDSLSDRLMYRLAYRNLGGHERLVVSHAVNPGNGTSAVRWYEVWDPNTSPTVHQQGTYAPDSSYRWMSSAAMDAAGEIAVGYSISSATMHPAIGFAAHQTTDATGTLGAETVVFTGTGSQTANLARWGDYSSMSIDPADDCTFWYTTEYLVSNGTWNWHTRIASFRLPNCGATATPDFSVSVAPTSQTVAQGTSAAYSVTVTPASSFTGSVALNVSGVSGTLSPSSLSWTGTGESQSSTLTVDTTTMSGTYPFTVTATGGGFTHSANASLTVTTTTGTGDFTITASPSTRQVTGTRTASYTITVASTNGFSDVVALTASAPSGVTTSLNPTSVTPPSGGSATSTLTASASTRGTYTITVTATSGSLTHTTAVTLRRK